MMSQAADLDTLKNVPGFKVILKAVLRSQIQQLVDQLSSLTHEESMLLTVSLDDGAICQLGSESGKHFLKDYTDVRMKFLKFCLRNPSKQYLDAADPHPQASRPAASANRIYFDATDPGHPQMKVSRSKLRKTSTFTASSSTVRTRPQPYPKSRRSGVDDTKKGATGSARKMDRATRNVPKLGEENLVDCDRTQVEHERELRGNTDSRLQSDYDSVDSVTKDSHSKNCNHVIFDTSADYIGGTEQSSKLEDDHTTSGITPSKWDSSDEISKSEMDHTISENSRNKTGIINSGEISGLEQGIDQESCNITDVVNTPYYKTGVSKTRSCEISSLEQGIDQERGNTGVVNLPSKATDIGEISGEDQGIDREDRGITGQVHLHRDVKHEAVHDAAADIGSFIEDAVTGYENSQNTPVLIGHMDGLVEAKSQVANEGADNFGLSTADLECSELNGESLQSYNWNTAASALPDNVDISVCNNQSNDVDVPTMHGTGYAEHSTVVKSTGAHQKRKRSTERNHQCAICQKYFVYNWQVVRHMRIHTGEKPFACNYCDYKTGRKDILKYHKLKNHLYLLRSDLLVGVDHT